MKVKNIFSYLVVAIVMLQLTACTSTDAEQKFDKTPTERLNGQKKELNDLLLSSEFGWKAVYFTDSTQLGGFTHLFKFLPDLKVDMASDFNADTKTYNSQYQIQTGSTVSLVFTTANRIHLLSDSNSYPTPALKGKGYLGDFQFLYYGQDKGDLIFRTNRKVAELRFVKATAQDWIDITKNQATINNINGSLSSPLFRVLETNDGSAVHKFDFSFSSDARFGKAASTDPKYEQSYNFGFSYTPTSAIAKPALVVKGQKLTNFMYDSTTNNFTATGTNGVSATVKFSNEPPTLTDDYKLFLTGKPKQSISYNAEKLYTASTTSPYAKSILDKVNAALPANQKITYVELYFNDPKDGTYIGYYFSGGKKAIYHDFTVTEDAVNKTIILKGGAWYASTEASRAFLKILDDEILNAKGLYIKKEDFTVFYSNTIYTYTSAASPFRLTNYLL